MSVEQDDGSMTLNREAVELNLPPSPPLPPSSSPNFINLTSTHTSNKPSLQLNSSGLTGYDRTRMSTPWTPVSELDDHVLPSNTVASTSTSTSLPIRPLDLASLPLSPLPHHLEPYLTSPLTVIQKRRLFTDAYLHSASAGNSDTLEYLVTIPASFTTREGGGGGGGGNLSRSRNSRIIKRSSVASISIDQGTEADEGVEDQDQDQARARLPDEVPRKWVDLEARDAEGNSALGLCVALGHAEGVRVLVEAGVDIMGGDKAGWTPLHWAVQNSDIPIAAYLLNHGASPLAASYKGLTPRDLVKRGPEGSAMRDVLRSAHEAGLERERARREAEGEGENESEVEVLDDEVEHGTEGSARPSSRNSWASSSVAGGGAASSRLPRWADDPGKVEEERRASEMMRRKELALESARNLEIDLGVLGIGVRGTPEINGHLRVDVDDEEEEQGIQNPFVWDRCEPDQMLVFSLNDLSVLFDVVITTMKPVRQRSYRVIPANVLFLCARYAHYFGSPELLEELVVGAMERIEAAVHRRPDDMANCAFWLSNCLLLLYYLRKEPNLQESTSEMQVHLCDLINEIFVFVIRDAERRIDRVLEPALLEHESLPGFEDVEFEGEWSSNRFVKKLTGGRSKKSSVVRSTSVSLLFSSVSSSASAATDLGDNSMGEVVNSSGAVVEASPRSVTALLSSTLFVLQLYEIPPSIIVQAFSQLLYWIACEMFNRLLTQRKYLCRSRAMQIRLNASSLEEWARQNRLPSKMVSVHFAPLNQLLQWLQCLSSEQAIDGLIGTIHSLRSLNPLQLRRAVRDYRYEVDEQHIDEDCSQYLAQIQSQWERMRLQRTVEGLVPGATRQPLSELEQKLASPSAEDAAEAQAKVTRMIDEVFVDTSTFGNYSPPTAAPAMGELLNSRYMLPFAVPTFASMLVKYSAGEAFGPFATTYAPSVVAPSLRHSISSLSLSSTASTSSNHVHARPKSDRSESDTSCTSNDADVPDPNQVIVPMLPDDFFAVLDAARAKVAATKPVSVGNGAGSGSGSTLTVRGAGLGYGEDVGTPYASAQAEGKEYDWKQGLSVQGVARNGLQVEDEDDEESTAEESVSGTDEDDSREIEATPRPRDGFQ